MFFDVIVPDSIISVVGISSGVAIVGFAITAIANKQVMALGNMEGGKLE